MLARKLPEISTIRPHKHSTNLTVLYSKISELGVYLRYIDREDMEWGMGGVGAGNFRGPCIRGEGLEMGPSEFRSGF